MNDMKLTTNVKCAACVAKITPFLNEVAGEGAWEVDLTNPKRVLTIKKEVSETAIKEALAQAGYKGETL